MASAGSVSYYSIDLLSNFIMLKRVDDWVNLSLTTPSISFDSIESAELKFKAGSSIDTVLNSETLSIYLDGDRIDIDTGMGDTHYIATGLISIAPSAAELILSSGSVVSIRTSGTADSWFTIEALTLELTVHKQITGVTGNLSVSVPKQRYRGSKEGAKFQRFSHEVVGACVDITINKGVTSSWDGSSISEYYTLMSLSEQFQHLRRILEWRKS